MLHKSLEETCIKASLEAGKFVRKNIGRIKDLNYKGKTNLVTNIDISSEAIIVKKIRKSFPNHDILAEEGSLFRSNGEFRWLIDPLDGTTNFVHTFPFFCVSIALEDIKNKQIVMGAVFDPIRNELFFAKKNSGSFLNKKRIRVSKIKYLKNSLLATGFSYNLITTKRNNLNNFKKFIYNSQAIRRAGSAAMDLSYVACGRFDGYWELDLNPWDTAAGFIIVKEAGGEVSTVRGGTFDPYKKEILASNNLIHKQMLDVFRKPLNTDKLQK